MSCEFCNYLAELQAKSETGEQLADIAKRLDDHNAIEHKKETN